MPSEPSGHDPKGPKGRVSLVGGGPGDANLITVKGLERIRSADVVIYDRLAPRALLTQAPADAELIDAGKLPGDAGIGQEAINRLLVEKAGKGKSVVRLKGGDPFLFGRGGEEALACKEAGVDFEVIPGVPSAVAVPAYAGIPVTHREVATSVTIVTGRESAGERRDWSALARSGGTLVLMMSVKELASITESLLEAGMAGETPVAAIEWGTLPRQRLLESTLNEVVRDAESFRLEPPSVVVVGEVARLSNEIDWRSSLPLIGKTVVVTRAREVAGSLGALFEEAGAEVISFPTIKTRPLADETGLRDAFERLGGGGFSWVAFLSANAVSHSFRVLREMGMDTRNFAGVKVAAIGPGTAEALGSQGIIPDTVPVRSDSESLLSEFALDGRGESVLILRASEGRSTLPEGLRARSFTVEEVAAYETVATSPQSEEVEELRSRLSAGDVDAVTFASSSTVRNFVELVGASSLPQVLVAIGPATGETARELGVGEVKIAADPSIEGLFRATVEALTDNAG